MKTYLTLALVLPFILLVAACGSSASKKDKASDNTTASSGAGAPALTWQDVSIDATCKLTASGQITFSDSAILDSASGTIGGAENVVASATGVSGVMKAVAEGAIRVTWSIVDSLNRNTTITRDVILSAAGEPFFTTLMQRPSALLDHDVGAGRQIWLPAGPETACGIANGRRGSLAVGRYQTCVLTKDNGVACWGNNDYGQLGAETAKFSTIPVKIPSVSNVIAVASGTLTTYALVGDSPDSKSGQVIAWGSGLDGELGDGEKHISNTPVTIVGLDDAVAIAASYYFQHSTCALRTNGQVVCWGENYYGQLGNNSTIDQLTPVTVVIDENATPLTNVVAIALGDITACALIDDGSIRCWGNNGCDQFAISADTLEESLVAVAVPGISDAVNIYMGVYDVCALMKNGTAKCWGGTAPLQAMNYVTVRPTPKVILDPSGSAPLENIIGLAAGATQECALLNTGAVYCWGANNYGQLGNPIVTDFTPLPVLVTGLSGRQNSVDYDPNTAAVALGCGYHNCCALLESGNIKCWGDGASGQLGGGSICAKQSEPVSVCTTTTDDCGACPSGSEFNDAAIISAIPLTAKWAE